MRKLYLERAEIAKEAAQIVREMLIGTKFETWCVLGNGSIANQPTVIAVDVDQVTPCRVEQKTWNGKAYENRFYNHFNFAFDMREIAEFYGKNTERWIRFIQQRCMDASEKVEEVTIFSVSNYCVDFEDVEKGRVP